jgi:3-isopropylmalate dehydrogenase
MLETLGELAAANAVEAAVKTVTGTRIKSLSAGKMGYTTSEIGDLVVGCIQT